MELALHNASTFGGKYFCEKLAFVLQTNFECIGQGKY